MKNKTIKQIENEIKEKKEQLKNVKGTETEVYTRIVGYYRSVKNWNVGQKKQRKYRKNFVLKGENYDKKIST